MEQRQPSERLWAALKRSAAAEPQILNRQRAEQRVRSIAAQLGVDALPPAAIRFYAIEYMQMAKQSRP
jgi:hypothetical protein